MSKFSKTIREIIVEMCHYWSITGADEVRTRRGFKKMGVDMDSYLCHVTPGQLIELYKSLRAKSRGSDESVRRHYDYVKRVFTYAHAQGCIRINPCALVKLPRGRKAPIVQLTRHEVELIEAVQVNTVQLQRARDWFLFQCYTGLAFSDFKSFRRANVVQLNGKQYLHGYRKKTDVEYFLPLSHKAVALCEKYNYSFGVGCIHFYNRKLKELQQKAGVATTLTTHVARRTYGQFKIDEGVPLETVSHMLGHSSTAMTEKKYARVGMVRVMRDMERVA